MLEHVAQHNQIVGGSFDRSQFDLRHTFHHGKVGYVIDVERIAIVPEWRIRTGVPAPVKDGQRRRDVSRKERFNLRYVGGALQNNFVPLPVSRLEALSQRRICLASVTRLE